MSKPITLKNCARWLLRGAIAWCLLLAAGVLLWSFATPRDDAAELASADAGADAQAWGSEALRVTRESMIAALPIALANACGLGASSCFKCHNGKRAPAPAADATLQPWHAQHKSVNYSCGGCHQGNARVLKKEIAHEGLITDPLAVPGQSCSTCHTGDAAANASRYLQLRTGNAQP